MPASGGRAGIAAGTSTSVAMPQMNILAPISSPSCSRLGKSTTSIPRNVAAVVHIPSSMLAAGDAMARIAAEASRCCSSARRCVTYSRTTPSTPKPEQHRRRASGGSRQRRAGVAEDTKDDDERQRRGQRSDHDEPNAAKHQKQKGQDQRQRSDAIDDAFAPDDRFGFESDSVPPCEVQQSAGARCRRLRRAPAPNVRA